MRRLGDPFELRAKAVGCSCMKSVLGLFGDLGFVGERVPRDIGPKLFFPFLSPGLGQAPTAGELLAFRAAAAAISAAFIRAGCQPVPLGIVDGHSEVRAARVRAEYFGTLGFEASGKVQTFTITCMRISSTYLYRRHIHGNLCIHVCIVFSSEMDPIDKPSR